MSDLRELLHRYETGEATAEEVAELSALIKSDPAAAREAAQWMLMTSDVAESLEEQAEPQPRIARRNFKLALASAAAVLLAVCGVAIYLLVFSAPGSPSTASPDSSPVATLIESIGGTLTTPTGFPAEGDEFPAGDYALDAGRAQFVLTNRVTVELRGETLLRMHNPANIYLARGHAEFKVPAGAEGFTVHLPDQSKIIDLGTAFEVDTDDAGRSRFRVTEGAVAWYAAPDADSVLVSAGQTVRIEEGWLHDVAVIAVTTQQLDTPPTVGSDDLAQTHLLASASVGTDEVSTRHAELFNGEIGNADGASTDTGEVKIAPGDSVTVTFDTSTHTRGYDISGIDTIFGWNPVAGGRSNQGFSITLTYIDGSTATLVEPTHWEPNTPASYWTKVSMRRAGDGALHSEEIALNAQAVIDGPSVVARGVKAVTFTLTHGGNAGGSVVAREIDIFGTPTTASPETNQPKPTRPENGNTPLKETPL